MSPVASGRAAGAGRFGRVRALLSVYDKSGIAELARRLHELGVELVSSGGTAAAIAEAGVPVVDVADYTGSPPMLGHRVVTLHPRIHGGILADRRDPSHLRDLETHRIDLIDLVVTNLYPFTSDPSVELIDIGGPAMVRAAAKNFEHVTVVVDPADYDAVLDELAAAGQTSAALRRRLARTAFAHTAAYDRAIVSWLDDEPGATGTTAGGDPATGAEVAEALPLTLPLTLERAEVLRYGENSHQAGARYRVEGTPSWWDEVIQHTGIALSYLNLFDADAAWQLVHELGRDRPACAIIKHANPCGAAVADDLASAYASALACDERSAFGGIVAVNQPIDEATVAAMEAGAQADVVIAPGYEPGVIARLQAKRKNTRVLEAPLPRVAERSIRQLSDGFLVQEPYRVDTDVSAWKVVTERQPTAAELVDGQVAWLVCAHVTSNAIVLAKDGVTWGIGAGQQNRVESGQIAATKAAGRAVGGACASDAFYPFPDGVEAAADAGVALVVQPGGSVNDEAVIAAANERGLAMVYTGQRQFRH
ncbi:MAG: bifunctional phosphoribosylaminoimidazolecarboxamide formyltransferase/IMP cyclohydrolase [Acidimicrobiales bacterium]